MSMSFRKITASLALLVLAGACGNERADVTAFSMAKSYVTPRVVPAPQTPEQVARMVGDALVSLDGPLALAVFEKSQNSVVLWQIETNGPYRTWTSWGNEVERRTVTTRNGMLTATRGLRSDLMSTDLDRTLALVTGRQTGTVTRTQRYLDGENQTVEMLATCTVSRGDQTRVQIGEIDRMAVEMIERCNAADRSFTNIYRVDERGRILQSAQWLNEIYGTMVIQALR
jgi:hypothetical protein